MLALLHCHVSSVGLVFYFNPALKDKNTKCIMPLEYEGLVTRSGSLQNVSKLA